MILLEGKPLAEEIKSEIRSAVDQMLVAGRRPPHLAAILVGNDAASQTYVASKVKRCKEVGFESSLIRLPASISQEALLEEIMRLNEDPSVDGFIVQLPLPAHIDEMRVIEAIRPEKDVDGFHPVNIGRMSKGLPAYIPATPLGILEMLRRYRVPTAGKHCVVIGRSQIVGLPMSILMARKADPGNATVTICHSHTRDLSAFTRTADIVIAALGKAEFLTASMVKEGAVVIDVGINRVVDTHSERGYVIRGDVKFDEVAPKCSYITPVPGGVGLMTVVSLLSNTLLAAQKKIYT